MTAIFNENNERQAVTLLQLPDSYVLKKNDYGTKVSTVVAADEVNPKRQSKAVRTMYEKANKKPMRKIKEFAINNELKEGDKLDIKSFEVNTYVDVKGIGKGKGFAGVMKRYNFSGQPASHGNTKTERKAGSTGQCADPGRVIKGKKMPGQMGNKNVAVQNLKISAIYEKVKMIAVHGSVPGAKGKYVYITPAVKKYSNSLN